MSVENVLRFLVFAKQDEKLDNEFRKVYDKYTDKTISEVEKDNICINGILPMAKEAGFEFTLEDFKKVQSNDKEGELSDTELNGVVGGNVGAAYEGRISINCYLMTDSAVFLKYFEAGKQNYNNGCPHWIYGENGPYVHTCGTCKKFCVSIS